MDQYYLNVYGNRGRSNRRQLIELSDVGRELVKVLDRFYVDKELKLLNGPIVGLKPEKVIKLDDAVQPLAKRIQGN